MTTFIIILLTVAYTIGLISLTVQLICYFKDIEYKETLLLTFSFIFVIITLNIKALSSFDIPDWLIFAENIALILLGSAIAFNMHAEREISHHRKRNRVLLSLTVIAGIVMAVLLFVQYQTLSRGLVNVYLTVCVIYSMLLTFFTGPSLLIRHREEQEKKAAKLILVFFTVYVIVGTLNDHFELMQNSFFEGPVLIAVIFIFLAVSKLADDIERLGLFAQKKSSPAAKISELPISVREKEVVELLLQGLTYNEIAERLFISLPTVKTHITNIYKKLAVRNKVELMNLLHSEPKI